MISAVWVEDTRGYWISERRGARWTYAPWDLNNSLLLYWRTWGAAAAPRVGELDAGLELPAGGVLRVEAPISAAGGEVGLHRGESYAGHEDLLYFGPLAPSYGRAPAGGESWGPR